ncbi:hypothetical protein CEXT_145451 [Caerostris extrusa]|uniref:Uncharacterized protein n=1 Tax=Caerostris extrusa TaxID=172846 RepID=A0AAV4Q537_CAEEX|nr:hypothetical protein CEXT_145451 [Caerostris extrusa]
MLKGVQINSNLQLKPWINFIQILWDAICPTVSSWTNSNYANGTLLLLKSRQWQTLICKQQLLSGPLAPVSREPGEVDERIASDRYTETAGTCN